MVVDSGASGRNSVAVSACFKAGSDTPIEISTIPAWIFFIGLVVNGFGLWLRFNDEVFSFDSVFSRQLSLKQELLKSTNNELKEIEKELKESGYVDQKIRNRVEKLKESSKDLESEIDRGIKKIEELKGLLHDDLAGQKVALMISSKRQTFCVFIAFGCFILGTLLALSHLSA